MEEAGIRDLRIRRVMKNKFDILYKELPKMHSFEDWYRNTYREDNNEGALDIPGPDGYKTIRYKECPPIIEEVEQVIRQSDLPAGSFIGIKTATSPQFVFWFWAVLKAGYNALLLDPNATNTQIRHLLTESDARAIIADKDALDFVEVPDSIKIYSNTDMPQAWSIRLVREATAAARDQSSPLERAGVLNSADRPFGNYVILATSGTTGAAKLYVHSGETLSNQFRALVYVVKDSDRWLRPDVQERSIAILPFHHILGFIVIFLLSQFFEQLIVFPKSKVPETWLETCRERGVTQLISVPLLWNHVARGIKAKVAAGGEKQVSRFNGLLDWNIRLQKIGLPLPPFLNKILKDVRAQVFGPDLRLCCSGGGRISEETLRFMNGIGFFLVNGYGLTETGIISVERGKKVQKRMDGSVGSSFLTGSLRLNEDSEIELLTDYLHCGVILNGEYIAADFSEDNWFRTGDVADLDAEERVFIRGRLKDVIIGASGENINPDDIEYELGSLDFFKNYTVLGIQQGDDEKVIMVAEPADTFDDLTAAEALRQKFGKLSILSRPGKVLLSSDPLPLSAALKVKRNYLREQIEANEWPYRELYLTESAREKAEEEIVVMEVIEEQKKQVNEVSVDRIRELMGEVLLRPVEEISARDDFIHDLEADSLQAVSLLAALENEYDVTIEEENFNNKLTAEIIADLLRDYKSGKKPAAAALNLGQPAAQVPAAFVNPNEESEIIPEITAAGLAEDPDSGESSDRVDTFEKTREYKAFAQRERGLTPIVEAFGNPYFVAHDSPLLDVSTYEGRDVLNFGSYNYLALSGDPEVNQAATEALLKYGGSASGSRLLAGEKSIHKELEQAIARWKHTEDCLVLVSGHATNVSFVGNFCNQNDLILYDVLCHNSIAQGLEISPASSRAFPHNDMEVLEGILKRRRNDYEKVLVIVEGAYSMDGDVAPVPELVALKKKYGFFLMVDEAHSAGILGDHGGGVDEYFNLEPDDIDIKMGTLSKTLGTCGGYLAGSKALINFLRYNLPGFVFSVGLSPVLAGATLKAVEIIERDNSRVKALQNNIDIFMREAKYRGFETPAKGESAIVPIVIGDDVAAFKLSMQMLENGVFVPPAVYPAVPRGQARLRFCLTSAHKEDQIIEALDLLEKLIMAK